MKINEIRHLHEGYGEAVITLNSDELTAISNLMYENWDCSKVDSKSRDLSASIIMARELCRKGRLDNTALENIMKHRIKAAGDENIMPELLKMLQKKDEGGSDALMCTAGKTDKQAAPGGERIPDNMDL